MKITRLTPRSFPKLVAALGLAALGALGVTDRAEAATTFNVGGGMGSSDTYGGAIDPYRTICDQSVHTTNFTLPPGTWQPFLNSGTSWQIGGWNNSTYGGEVRIDVIAVGLFGGQTIVSSFVRSFDSTGALSGLDDNQDLGSFVSSAVLLNGKQNFILKVTASACGGNGYASTAHMINTSVALVSF